MDVSYQVNLTVDGKLHDLLTMTATEIEPLMQQFGNIGAEISEEVQRMLVQPEEERDDAWHERLGNIDTQMTEVATVFQLCMLTYNRWRTLNPPVDEGVANESGEPDEAAALNT